MKPLPKKNHFLDISEFETAELRRIIDCAHAMKASERGTLPETVSSLSSTSILALIFDKPSTRTRVSFDVAMRQLGGQSLVLNMDDMQLGRGETIADTARVLSRYVDVIMLRTGPHSNLAELATHADVPVINGLTDDSHPCQVMADLMTFEEHKGNIENSIVAWTGDGNNVAASWIHAAAKFNFTLRLGCPEPLSPDPALLQWAKDKGADVQLTTSHHGRPSQVPIAWLQIPGSQWAIRTLPTDTICCSPIRSTTRSWPWRTRTRFSCIVCPRTATKRSPTR